jgi:hypothetical protein
MGHSNYKLTDEQKRELDRIADSFIYKIEDELLGQDGILDAYTEDRKIDNDKVTAMLWYIGDCISAC